MNGGVRMLKAIKIAGRGWLFTTKNDPGYTAQKFHWNRALHDDSWKSGAPESNRNFGMAQNCGPQLWRVECYKIINYILYMGAQWHPVKKNIINVMFTFFWLVVSSRGFVWFHFMLRLLSVLPGQLRSGKLSKVQYTALICNLFSGVWQWLVVSICHLLCSSVRIHPTDRMMIILVSFDIFGDAVKPPTS